MVADGILRYVFGPCRAGWRVRSVLIKHLSFPLFSLDKQVQMPQPGNASKPGGKRVESTSGQPSTLRSPFQEDQSMTEQRTVDRAPLQTDQSVTEQRTVDRSPLQTDQSVTEQRTVDSVLSPFNSDKQRTADNSSSNIRTARAKTESSNSKQGARPKEVTPSSTERTATLEGYYNNVY